MRLLITFLISFVACSSVSAQQLVYKPINPAFGGDTFNYQWLLSSAAAQNQFDNKERDLYKQLSPIGSFSDNLDRQILNQLSRELFGGNFGDVTMEPGDYTLGNMFIQIKSSSGGTIITIFDTKTGEQTEILLP